MMLSTVRLIMVSVGRWWYGMISQLPLGISQLLVSHNCGTDWLANESVAMLLALTDTNRVTNKMTA